MPRKCSKCGDELIQLLTSWSCDCDKRPKAFHGSSPIEQFAVDLQKIERAITINYGITPDQCTLQYNKIKPLLSDTFRFEILKQGDGKWISLRLGGAFIHEKIEELEDFTPKLIKSIKFLLTENGL